jgi:Sec-independent protein secretion pathway component TatC
LLVSIPLLILFEVGILISARVMKQKEKSRKEFFNDDDSPKTETGKS